MRAPRCRGKREGLCQAQLRASVTHRTGDELQEVNDSLELDSPCGMLAPANPVHHEVVHETPLEHEASVVRAVQVEHDEQEELNYCRSPELPAQLMTHVYCHMTRTLDIR